MKKKERIKNLEGDVCRLQETLVALLDYWELGTETQPATSKKIKIIVVNRLKI